jgi:hypothetical protein
MSSSPGTNAAVSVEPAVVESPLRIHHPDEPGPALDPLLSPSIQQVVGEKIDAFELKFLVPPEKAAEIQDWAAKWMEPDPYADPGQAGSYQITTLYLDTPQRDVFHRAAGHRSRKFRLRRYGAETRIYLERKTRRGDRVAKRRCDVPLDELAVLTGLPALDTWPGEWFRSRIDARGLQPTCRLTYDRTAFVLRTDDGPLRLTLDRRIRGVASGAWDLSPLGDEHTIPVDHVVCELKFRGVLPHLFKELIYALQLAAGSFSKYRRTMLAIGTLPAVGRNGDLRSRLG